MAEPALTALPCVGCIAQPDEEAAFLHYYFAALEGDDYARMVLGYRHMQGVGVPKSCWTAASYYQPVAEKVWEGTAPRVRKSLQDKGEPFYPGCWKGVGA